MAKRHFRLAHYYGVVAAVYFVAFLVIGLVFDGSAPSGTLFLAWSAPFVGAAFGCVVTFVFIFRFGNMGGSRYFAPTVAHIGLVLSAIWAFWWAAHAN